MKNAKSAIFILASARFLLFKKTLPGSIVSTIIDSIMVIYLVVMMLLYGGWLFGVVLGFSVIYLLLRMRMVTYLTYRQISEEQIIRICYRVWKNCQYPRRNYGDADEL